MCICSTRRARPARGPGQYPTPFWSDGPIHTDVEGMPNILRSAVIARAHLDDYALPFPPLGVQRVLFGLLAPLGRALGYSALSHLKRRDAQAMIPSTDGRPAAARRGGDVQCRRVTR
jgi:hypothetical protein